MKKNVKAPVLITIAVLALHFSNAQLKLPLLNGIGSDIKKVIEDYPNRFSNLLGELIIENPQSTDYQCNFKVNGAEETTITRYTSSKNTMCSWQSVMLTTENFDKARQKYHSFFSQLNNLSVKPADAIVAHLKGTYINPVEEKVFTSVIFSLEPAHETTKKLIVELTLEYELLEWKVKILVYDREREDNERGKTIEE